MLSLLIFLIFEGGNKTLKHYGFPNYMEFLHNKEYVKTEVIQMAAKPKYSVSTPVKTGEGTFWLRIGAGWEKKGGISIELNALPVNNKLFIAEFTEEKKEVI